MAITEKVQLLGAGLYKDIPEILTLKSLPTASELDYVSSEDFQQTMLTKILPQAVEEKIDFRKLLDIDYSWICRALRILNYGPYYTTNSIFCPKCGVVSGEYRVDLRSIEVKTLPEGFTNDVVISKDEFIDFDEDIHLHLLRVGEVLDIQNQKIARELKIKSNSTSEQNEELLVICQMIHAIGQNKGLTSMEVYQTIQNKFSPADYKILKEVARELTDYGLRVGGNCTCPKCGSEEAGFFALQDDKFFRPTLGDLREWKRSKNSKPTDDL